MHNEKGYILLLVVVMVTVIACTVVILANRTFHASFFAARRELNAKALALAENAAMEAYWQLVKDPTYRPATAQERHWGTAWYRYAIQDSTPLDPSDDLQLIVTGQGFVRGQQRGVKLVLRRINTAVKFSIHSWAEQN